MPRTAAAKGTSQRGETEKERDAKLPLFALIPHGEVKDDTGEESTLGHAEEEARDEEAGEVLDDAHECGYDTPCDGERGEPESGCCSFEDDVAGDLR